jgi:hypothetical protein
MVYGDPCFPKRVAFLAAGPAARRNSKPDAPGRASFAMGER